jgi:hypothetical protein
LASEEEVMAKRKKNGVTLASVRAEILKRMTKHDRDIKKILAKKR